ncbi:hypothetical protein [Dysgonomonas macrotermitis]|uniref:Lipoprotein n=1 Tax=Dysgonomonas macrotermitis TaxID=1346286 RepID=A0A1M4SWC8_9BACT|nr:hypothetical protein [Dysgonomonas macrotermitis]SHE36524.1 hypothetical protein SAMN05444362_101168 [Dysgonomonas macrotermitis]
MKNILLIFSFLFLLVSCSNDEPSDSNRGGNHPEDSGFVRLGINTSAKDANIFENVQFTLYPDRDCTMLEVRESYDSLIWIIPELDGLFEIMRTSEFTFSWGHSFSSEGKYHTILQGFKDKKMVLADTIIVNIKNGREILGYNWKDITESQSAIYGTTNILDSRYSIYTRKLYENESPALEIYFQLESTATIPHDEQKRFYEQEQEKIIYDYITGLYDIPKLSYDKDREAITDMYKNTFKKGDKNLLPKYIWETNTSRIVLLEVYDEWNEWHSHFVIAEPKN